jgi:peptidoglycan/xylan/chitin deacetylase (PgdA/CDA1 family)
MARGTSSPKALPRHVVRKRRPPVIVVYHHISEETDPLTNALSVRTDPETFRGHLKHFAKNYDLIASDDLLYCKSAERPLLVTFDDNYKSVLETAGPLLRDLHAPSVWFLNPLNLKSHRLPFDNMLSLAVEEFGTEAVLSLFGLGLPSTKRRTHAMLWSHVATLSPAGLQNCKRLLSARLGRSEADIRAKTSLFLSLEDLEKLKAFEIELGNHSMSHTFFRNLNETELDSEIRESRQTLMENSGLPVSLLAIPYGFSDDAPDTVVDIARTSGHQAIFLVQARSNRWQPAQDIFYRVDAGNTATRLLPIALQLLPRLRSLRYGG